MGLLDSAGEREATGGFREGRPGPSFYAGRLVVPVAAPVTAPVVPAIISAVIAPVVAPVVAIIPAVIPAVAILVIPAPIAIVIPVEIIVVIDPVVPPAALVEPNPVEPVTVIIVVPVVPAVVIDDDDARFPPELLEPPMIEPPISDANPVDPAHVPGTVVVTVPAISDDDAAADRTATDADVRLHPLSCCRGGRKQGEQEGGTENKIASAHGVLPDKEVATTLRSSASAVPFPILLCGNGILRLRGPICPRPGTSLRGARDIADGPTLYSARRLFS